MILLDTNILIRLANRNDADYRTTHAAISGCIKNGQQLAVVDQNLHEFWAVATRPVIRNGMGMTPARADLFLTGYLRFFQRITDPISLFDEWRALANAQGITGIQAYDVRLAAVVRVLSLRGLMTYNLKHFSALSITVVDPKDPSTW
jgi:predicted nucleic acid-binding protein